MEMPTTLKEARDIIEAANESLKKAIDRIDRAEDLLRQWRDKYGGREHYKMGHDGIGNTASPTDLIRDTQRWLERR